MSKKELEQIKEERARWQFESDFWDTCKKHPNLPIRSLIRSLAEIIVRLTKQL